MSRSFLIVDDSPVIRMTLQKMLCRMGVAATKVHAACDGETALSAFQELSPDIVFLDIEMPGLDGEQAANAMLQLEPETKVIVVTGLEREDERIRRLVSLGAFEVLSKPLHSDQVRNVLALADREDHGLGRI